MQGNKSSLRNVLLFSGAIDVAIGVVVMVLSATAWAASLRIGLIIGGSLAAGGIVQLILGARR